MNKIIVARELVKIAKELLGAEWEAPRGERKTWRRENADGTYEYRDDAPEGKEPDKGKETPEGKGPEKGKNYKELSQPARDVLNKTSNLVNKLFMTSVSKKKGVSGVSEPDKDGNVETFRLWSTDGGETLTMATGSSPKGKEPTEWKQVKGLGPEDVFDKMDEYMGTRDRSFKVSLQKKSVSGPSGWKNKEEPKEKESWWKRIFKKKSSNLVMASELLKMAKELTDGSR